jgi:hypothetical protein
MGYIPPIQEGTMRRLLFACLLSASCTDIADPVEVEQGVLIVVEPKPGPVTVSCTLEGDACRCTSSECSEDGINAVVMECNRLRSLIVVE